ncbi:LytR C-terminal domain-containing protein [Streptomyces yaanensis]|uniref:LytR C-terminal domain-containing protein n=1 Tax=Streptomyces yaanensis TaxID=1142239 RepID=A0ABV7S8P1_9ACTN|nr:LytR C-terminal domain-containing protein [Streptomyces sp. CGMCC 4.7035]WNC02837.1 LytR C-terminal domain-containing protein [Streptomyces sp. CGMCC 4.7035]
MSMLTPPGMGGQYRITGDKYPRMRRPRRRGRLAFAIVASVAALGLIGWGTLQLIDVFTGGGDRASASGSKACTTKASASHAAAAKALPQPGQITVNVFNATARTGLAKETADELKKRGFRIGTVGNATKEYDKKVKGTGILLGAKASLGTSLPVLGTQLADAERRADASRKDPAVDLVLGDRFKSLTSKAEADKALAALTAPTPSPSAGKNTKKSC